MYVVNNFVLCMLQALTLSVVVFQVRKMTCTWLITSSSVCYRQLNCLLLFLGKEKNITWLITQFALCMLQALILSVCFLGKEDDYHMVI